MRVLSNSILCTWKRLNAVSISNSANKCSEAKFQGGRVENVEPSHLTIGGINFTRDEWTNVSSKTLSCLDRRLHLNNGHPLSLVRRRIVDYIHRRFTNRVGNPLFSEHNNLSPVVSVFDNFDSLLVATDHPSRKPSDSYYLNQEHMLRAHMTAHDSLLIRSGLDNFLLVGDCYRRDEIDRLHYPVFHQLDAVRLKSQEELFKDVKDNAMLSIFDKSSRNLLKQQNHSLEAVKLMEFEMKTCLVGLSESLFGKDFKYRWVEAFFPFTHPSWELELLFNNDWFEVAGCGILEQDILSRAGVESKIGWAFGMGLERIAMKLYNIPDIRLFWSQDTGFLSQFDVKDMNTPITFKALSHHPQCINDISFWIPEDYEPNDFYDLSRTVAGDMIEQIKLVDTFVHPRTKQISHCYRIVYRHMERSLNKEEVNSLHRSIEEMAREQLKVEIR